MSPIVVSIDWNGIVDYFSVVGMFYVMEMSQMFQYFNQNKVLPVYVTDIVDNYYFQILSEKSVLPSPFLHNPFLFIFF